MKKSLIAGAGVAALGLAVLPATGVFAAAINTLTDNIQVTVPASCSITNDNYVDDGEANQNLVNNYAKTIYNGQYAVIGASDTTGSTTADNTIGVTCNSQTGTDAGWRLTAIGAGVSGHETQLWNGADAINSAATPVTAAGGATSDWSFRVNIVPGTNNTVQAASGFTSNTFTQIPGDEKNIATGTGTAAEGTFTMDYGVYVSGTQASGTYNGAVKYTLYNPAS